MAAAVFKALFRGDDNYDIEPDPGAVVIWFSDDPSLNEQSRFRLMEASDRLSISDLVVVQNTFQREVLEAGEDLLPQHPEAGQVEPAGARHIPDDEGIERTEIRLMPDSRSTIRDTIQNTIDDPALTLYLVLDEAHRGMRAATGAGEKTTIVERRINGSGPVPGIPVVWGISATVERFNDAMTDMTGRATLPNMVVDSAKVQASGLLKDTIILDVPKEAGHFDTVLVRRGTDKLKEISSAWESMVSIRTMPEQCCPLWFCRSRTRQITTTSAGLSTPSSCSGRTCPRMRWRMCSGNTPPRLSAATPCPISRPNAFRNSTWVCILIAKDAISTGWDCPRAEVMVSFRPARDQTHITQLLGRMVRTPLARRIPGNERLNSVDCLLPFFDKPRSRTSPRR